MPCRAFFKPVIRDYWVSGLIKIGTQKKKQIIAWLTEISFHVLIFLVIHLIFFYRFFYFFFYVIFMQTC